MRVVLACVPSFAPVANTRYHGQRRKPFSSSGLPRGALQGAHLPVRERGGCGRRHVESVTLVQGWGRPCAASAQSAGAGGSVGEEPRPEQQDDQQGQTEDTDAPSLLALVMITLPFMAVWLSNPLLSLIDSSIVGLASTLHLAALAPATAICNNVFYILGFLGIATTTIVARARARAAPEEAQTAAEQAVAIAALAGLAFGVIFFVFATPITAAFVGTSGTELLAPAALYTKIRAVGFPFGLVMTVSQAACLAYKDVRPPLAATAMAAIINLAGDVLLCCFMGMGIAGAAWATVAAQAGAAFVLLWQMQRAAPGGGARPALLRTLPPPMPSLKVWARFARIGFPVAFVIIAKVSYWTFNTHQATRLSIHAAASHGVIMAIFAVVGILGDAVSQVAQASIPAVLGRPAQAKALAGRLLQLGLLVGVCNGLLFFAVASLSPGLFTTSAEVAAGMLSIAPVAAACLLLHNASMTSEGIMLASGQLRFLVISYVWGAGAAMATTALAVSLGWGLPGIWLAVFQFQCTRLGQNGFRLAVSKHSPLKSYTVPSEADGETDSGPPLPPAQRGELQTALSHDS